MTPSDGREDEVCPPNTSTPPEFIKSPVLQQVYPDLIINIEKYGHPNIPLGTEAGRYCKTLRRLATQKKLTEDEMHLLESLGFRFNSFEDIYKEADFDDCLCRLIQYEHENKTNFQIPKKYKQDPELGAWVTVIRRIGKENIEADRREKLDAVGFAWVSTRKCGSSFMKIYREIKDGGPDSILGDEKKLKWLKAQKEIYLNGKLSAEREEYLNRIFPVESGLDWKNLP